MIFNPRTLGILVIIVTFSAYAHPHNPKPLVRASSASPVPVMMWATRNTALNSERVPNGPMFRHLHRSHHEPVGQIRAASIKEVSEGDGGNPVMFPVIEEGKMKDIELTGVTIKDSHAFDTIQHAPFPNGLPRGFIHGLTKKINARTLLSRKQFMERTQQLATVMADVSSTTNTDGIQTIEANDDKELQGFSRSGRFQATPLTYQSKLFF